MANIIGNDPFLCKVTVIFTNIFFSEETRWALIIGVAFAAAGLGMVGVLYACRCTSFCHKENEVWKKVADNLVIASPSQIGGGNDDCAVGDGNGIGKNPGEWQRDGVLARKTAYQRATSRESAQVRKSQQKRTERRAAESNG
jgi:hypothetical protein